LHEQQSHGPAMHQRRAVAVSAPLQRQYCGEEQFWGCGMTAKKWLVDRVVICKIQQVRWVAFLFHVVFVR
jgi:endonuclease YncB( thermonuclease family)